jgi:hypothetical protein
MVREHGAGDRVPGDRRRGDPPVASAGRCSPRLLHGLGLVALLTIDELHNPARMVYTPMEMVFAAAFFAVAAMVGHSIAHRTRALVLQGASAAVLAERARQRLGVYVSEEVASSAMAGELALGGSNMKAAVLFSDLRGFTRYAEGLAPERLVEELNAYLHEMVAEIRAEGGVVDKYIGDAIMAVFGVPSGHPDDAARAIRAAARMRVALRGITATARRAGCRRWPTGSGCTTGRWWRATSARRSGCNIR